MDPDMAQEHKPVLRSVRRRNNMETAFEKAKRDVLSLQLTVKKAAERYGVPMAELENSTKMDIPVKKLTATQKKRRRVAKVRNGQFRKLLLHIEEMEKKQKLTEGSGELAPSGREEKQELAADKSEKKPKLVHKKKKKQKESVEGRLKRLISQRERRKQQRLMMWKNCRDRAEALLKAKMAGKSSQASLEENKVLLSYLEGRFVAVQKESLADLLLPWKPLTWKLKYVQDLERQPYLEVADDRRARLSRLRATDPSKIMKGVW